jgi:hypothetical protein
VVRAGGGNEKRPYTSTWIDIPVVFLLTRETILEETKTKLVADLNAQALGVS